MLTAIGTVIVGFLGSSLGKISIVFTIVFTAFLLLPFKLEIPSAIYNVLTTGSFKQVMNSLYYFFPVDFAVTCLLIILISHNIDLIMRVINWIIDKVR